MPPEQSSTPPENFDFIMQSSQPKANRFGAGANKNQRILFAAIGGLVLIIVFFVFLSVVKSINNKGSNELVDLAAYQTELARVIGIGANDSPSIAVRGTALTARLTIITDLVDTKAYLDRNNIKVKASDIEKYKTAKIDSDLAAAKTSNNFDAIFMDLMDEKLENYKAKLATVFAAQKNASVQQALRNFKAHAELLPFDYSAPVTKL